jgi:uncharacterized membrane protein
MTAARRYRERGSAVLYTILLSPILMLSLALVVEVGAIQLTKERLRSAADMATVDAAAQAANSAFSGRLDPAVADAATRQALVDNLSPLESQISGGATALSVADDATVYVVTSVPAADPLHPGQVLTVPTIESQIQVPINTGLLAAAVLPQQVTLTIDSIATVREAGSS